MLDVSGSSPRSAYEVRVAPTPKGSLAVWTRWTGGEGRIQARMIGRNGSLGSVRTLSASGLDACFPKLVVAADGSAMVGWWVDGSNPMVQGRRIRANGTLGPILTVGGSKADRFDLALGADGAATFVWVRAEAMYSVKARRIEPDNSMGPVHDLTGERLDAWSPAVAVGADGVATAVWERLADDGQDDLVESRRIDPAGALGPVTRLGTGRPEHRSPAGRGRARRRGHGRLDDLRRCAARPPRRRGRLGRRAPLALRAGRRRVSAPISPSPPTACPRSYGDGRAVSSRPAASA